MSNNDNLEEIKIQNQKIIENAELSIWEAMIPVFCLLGLLFYNIKYADGNLLGDYSTQYILLISGGIAMIVGFFNKVPLQILIAEVWENWRSEERRVGKEC